MTPIITGFTVSAIIVAYNAITDAPFTAIRVIVAFAPLITGIIVA